MFDRVTVPAPLRTGFRPTTRLRSTFTLSGEGPPKSNDALPPFPSPLESTSRSGMSGRLQKGIRSSPLPGRRFG